MTTVNEAVFKALKKEGYTHDEALKKAFGKQTKIKYIPNENIVQLALGLEVGDNVE